MAEHRISAKLDLNTRDAQRSMEQAKKSSQALERQMTKTNRVGSQGLKSSNDASAIRKRIELIDRETRAVGKLAQAYSKVGSAQQKNARTQQSMRAGGGGGTGGGGIGSNLGNIGAGGAATAGIALLYGIGKRGLDTYRQEDVLQRYNKTVGGTDVFNQQLLDLAGRTGISRTEALTGGYQALSAGTKNNQEALSVTRASAEASVLGGPGAGMEDMSKLLTSMQLAFAGKNGPDFSDKGLNKLNDMLFETTARTNLEYKDLPNALGQSMSTAATVGVSQSQLLAYIGTMKNKGIDPSEAGTAMNQMMLQLLAGTPQSKEFAKSKGIDISQERISKEGLNPVMKDIYDKLGNDVDSLQEIFGNVRGLKGFLAAFSDGGKAVQDLQDGIEKANHSNFSEKLSIMGDAIDKKEQRLTNALDGWTKSMLENTGLATLYGGALDIGTKTLEGMAESMKAIPGYVNDLGQWFHDTVGGGDTSAMKSSGAAVDAALGTFKESFARRQGIVHAATEQGPGLGKAGTPERDQTDALGAAATSGLQAAAEKNQAAAQEHLASVENFRTGVALFTGIPGLMTLAIQRGIASGGGGESGSGLQSGVMGGSLKSS